MGVGLIVPLVAAMSLLGACATSPGSLEKAVRDEPGVIKVDARESDGDDGIPFAKVPKHVTILMDADASATQIMAVFDAYDGDIDDGDVEGIEVVLDGPKRATLSTGEGIHAAHLMAQELVEAQDDSDVIEYRREAHPVLPGVYLTLVPLEFDEVVSLADRYRNTEGIEYVQLVSGGFLLIRDEVDEDLTITEARERFVQRANLRFRLTGAVIAGRGPLKLFVAPAQRHALQEYVDNNAATRTLGRIIVRATAQRAS